MSNTTTTKQPKHLFLALYGKNFNGHAKALTEYIQDYDKTKPLMYFGHDDVSHPLYNYFRNLDELPLNEKSFINFEFALTYMRFLQSNDTYEDISLQRIFELSCLRDVDKEVHPDTAAFRAAYRTDSNKAMLNVHIKSFQAQTLLTLGCTDLEFSRRLMDTCSNAELLLDDGTVLVNSFNEALITQKSNYNKALVELEKSLLERIDAPSNVVFDGTRFTIFQSTTTLMFDIDGSPVKYNVGGRHDDSISKRNSNVCSHEQYFGGVNISQPTIFSTSTKDIKARQLLTRENKKITDTYDYDFKEVIDSVLLSLSGGVDIEFTKTGLELISFILLLKNGGKTKRGECISEIFDQYKSKRNSIHHEHSGRELTQAQISVATQLVESSRGERETVVFLESNDGGYISVFSKYYIKSKSKKLSTRAEFYDKDLNLIGETSEYKHYVMTRGEEKRLFKNEWKHKSTKEHLAKEMMTRTFRELFSTSKVLAIDYAGVNTKSQLRDTLAAFELKETHPLELSKSSFKKVSIANSITTYASLLQKQIKYNGFADIQNYEKAVQIIKEGIMVSAIESENYDVSDEYAENTPTLDREVQVFIDENDNIIDCQKYSALKHHVRFGDVEYNDNVTHDEGFIERYKIETLTTQLSE